MSAVERLLAQLQAKSSIIDKHSLLWHFVGRSFPVVSSMNYVSPFEQARAEYFFLKKKSLTQWIWFCKAYL
jgi:hypothetical protein